MRVLVTGGNGLVGRALVERLVRHGWDVRVIGIEPEANLPGAEYTRCDLLNYAALRDQVRGCERIVHLAALPHPRDWPGTQVFQVNVAGTFNLFEAAAAEGIRRVVQASSINAIGNGWGTVDIQPRYLPIDEEHPAYTSDPYSFSKQLVEDIGAYYWRRDGISSVAMRFPAVLPFSRDAADPYWLQLQPMRDFLDAFAALPADERAARIAEVRAQARDFRGRRAMEYGAPDEPVPPNRDELLWLAYTFDRFNYWTFVDDRDSAQAMEKALLADFEGSHPLFINSDRNWLGYDSATLARLFFPEVWEWKRPLVGSESLVSIDKARALIGFEPEFATMPRKDA
jgi:nucleoside-diphosphate-sugar epimerase